LFFIQTLSLTALSYSLQDKHYSKPTNTQYFLLNFELLIMPSQRSTVTPSLRNLNNHSSLRRNNGVLSSTTLRLRDPRASSPSRGSGTGGGLARESRSPSPQRDQFTAEPVTSRDLSLEELNLFNTLAMDAGLDPVHRERGQKHAEVSFFIAIGIDSPKQSTH
jgi:hypothetical protein